MALASRRGWVAGELSKTVVIRLKEKDKPITVEIKAVRQWRYSPATLKCESVAVWMTVTVTYHVTG